MDNYTNNEKEKEYYVPFNIYNRDKDTDKIVLKDSTSVKFSQVVTEFRSDFIVPKNISINLKLKDKTPLKLFEYEMDYGFYHLLHMQYTDKVMDHDKDGSLKEAAEGIDIICFNSAIDRQSSSDSSIFLISDVVSLDHEFDRYADFIDNVFDSIAETSYGFLDMETLLEDTINEFDIYYMDRAYEIHDLEDVAKADYQHFKKLVDYNHLEAVFRQFDYSYPKIFKYGEYSWHNIFMRYIQSKTKNLSLE